METLNATIKNYILNEFLQGTAPAELTESTPLITGGILDSLATVQLVSFIEEQFGIEVAPYEVSIDYLNTISDISDLVRSKKGDG